MADTNQLLEILQADVYAVLKNTPGLALANVISDNEGDIEAKVGKALSTLTETGGKNGLAVVVLLPEIIEAEANLPGPPFVAKVEIRTLEYVLINRAAASGSLVRSSQAALSVLSALHLRHLGHCLLAAEKDPVAPVEVKKGHVSHAVTLTARYNGLVTSKPLGVAASMSASGLSVSVAGSSLMPTGTGDYTQFGTLNGRPDYHFTSGGDVYFASWNGSVWTIGIFEDGGETRNAAFLSGEDVATPDLVTGWTALASGSISVTANSALTLTCTSAGSSIRYTTDGSYPSPTATLYTAPVTGLSTGTVVRAAAYVSGQAPGDVLEFTLT